MTSTYAVPEERPASITAGILRGAASAISGFVQRSFAAFARARTMRILSRLDDGTLKDIGVTLSQIDSIDQDPRYGRRRSIHFPSQ